MAFSLATGAAALAPRPAASLLVRSGARLCRARTFSSAAAAVHSGPLASQLRDPSLFRQQAYVDGRWSDAVSGAKFSVTDPATGETIGICPDMGGAETEAAIAAAKEALPAWRAKTGKERAAVCAACPSPHPRVVCGADPLSAF